MTEGASERIALIEAAVFEILRILTPIEAVPFVAQRIAGRMDQAMSVDDIVARLDVCSSRVTEQ